MNGIETIDLFAGGGGMSLGFGKAGFRIVTAFDNWIPAINFYRRNIADHPVQRFDLSNSAAFAENLKDRPFLIIGGPPCQDFSSAGKRDENLGRADLTLSFADIVRRTAPPFFVMENVERALKSRTLGNALSIFRGAGYGLTIRVLDASLCGVPQQRKRLFVIGELGGVEGFLDDALQRGLAARPMTLRDYFGNSLGLEHYYRHPRSYARRGIFSIDEPSPTVRGVNRPLPAGYPGHSGDTSPIHAGLRPLTTRERSLIQTFPSHFVLDGNKTDLEQIIGNAVPVKLAEYVARALMEYIQTKNITSVQRNISDHRKRALGVGVQLKINE